MMFHGAVRESFLSIAASAALLANFCLASPQVDISDLDAHLQSLVPSIYPGLEVVSRGIYNHPEIGRNETFAHNSTISYFQNNRSGEWEVYPTILTGLPTAWKIEFSHTPANWPKNQPLPTVGFMSEFDALAGIGHACGHHLIWLQGVYAASLTRQALIDYDIAGHIVGIGTPDEEESAGKYVLDQAGIFDVSQVWLMSHPSIASAIQPMSSRQNIVVKVIQNTHFEAVKAAYNMLVPLKNITGLPGNFSTAALIEDVGLFVCNVVQADISLGVVGPNITTVNNTINAIKASNSGYASTNFTLASDPNIKDGVQIFVVGNAGHAAGNNLGALTLSIDAFQALNALNVSFEFYLPDNVTKTELDFTVDVRTRWTSDLPSTVSFVLGMIPTKNYTLDTMYPAYEPDPFLGPLFIDTIALPAYGSQHWPLSQTPPAATDASWVQQANVLAQGGNHTLQSVEKAVLHANYNVCQQPTAACPFNHDPGFQIVSGTDYAFNMTEKISRAIARIAVELLNDPELMKNVTSDVRNGPPPQRK
jgi:hypothetical protein